MRASQSELLMMNTNGYLPEIGGKGMMGLKVAGACWVMSVAGMSVLGQITPADAGQKLMYGGAQVILGVCVLGLTVAIIWIAKKLLAAMEKRVEEATTRGDEIKGVLASNQECLEKNSVALSENAVAAHQLKDAVYKLGEVVDRKLDKT
jgi:hypothetical protein